MSLPLRKLSYSLKTSTITLFSPQSHLCTNVPLCKLLNSRYRIKFAFEKNVFKNSKTIYSTDSMGVLAKLGAVFIILVMATILLYLYDKPLFYNIVNSFITSLGPYRNKTASNEQIVFVTNETKAIESSSPIPITKFLVFGTGSNIQNITDTEFANMFYNFSTQGTPNLSVLYDGFYVPTYQIIKETYYKSNSTSIGDYMPSLIEQKVYLNFIAINNKNISAPYIVKSEIIQGNDVILNLTYDGIVTNTTKIFYNNTIDCLNGIIFLNHTALISPVNPCIVNEMNKSISS